MNFNEIPWTSEIYFPILGVMQFLPGITGIAIYFIRAPNLSLRLGLATVLIELWLGYWFYLRFVPLEHDATTFHLVERLPLLGPLSYHVGADGLTVIFMLLTAFLSLIVVLYGAKVRRLTPLHEFISIALLTESALMMQFATIDLLWFALTSAMQIPLIGLLLRRWATSAKEEGIAVTRYYQFMGFGLLLLISATIVLGWNHVTAASDLTQGAWNFGLTSLMHTNVPHWEQSAVFYLLLYGLAIRVPLFPLHGWLPDVAEHGTVASAMLLLLGLKSGIYGMLRYLFPLLPDAVWEWHKYVVAFAVIGVFYAASLALMQQNLRRLLAYAVVSHTGLMVIGFFSLIPNGFQGGAMLTINFGLAISTLLLMIGSVYARTGSLLLANLGGLFDRMHFVAGAFLIATLAIIGMPMTPGFYAVHLVLEAAIERFGALTTIAAALGNIAAASCLLWAFQRAFLATPIHSIQSYKIHHEHTVEKIIASIMISVQLFVSFSSGPWMRLVEGYAYAVSIPYQVNGVVP